MTAADVLFVEGGWAYVDDGTARGYMGASYLLFADGDGAEKPDNALVVDKKALWDVYNALGAILGVVG